VNRTSAHLAAEKAQRLRPDLSSVHDRVRP
jgi:hypothetical protein